MQKAGSLDGLGQLMAAPETFSIVAAHLLPSESVEFTAWLDSAHQGLNRLESYLANPGVGRARIAELRGESFFDLVASAEADTIEILLEDSEAHSKVHKMRTLLLRLADEEE